METITLSTEQIWLVITLAIWTLVWKGFALWKAARQDDKLWFVILIVVNTVGLLEILYIFVFSKSTQEK